MQKKVTGFHNAASMNAAKHFTELKNAARINAAKHFTGFHDAARINAAIFFLQLLRRLLSVAMRFTVGGDAEHYTTVGANAAFLLLLVHVLPFTIMLGSTLEFFSSSLHMFGQLLPVTECLLHSSNQHYYCRRDRPPLVRSGETTLFGGLYCPFFIWLRLAARSFTAVLPPPPTLLLGRMLPVFCIRLLRDPLRYSTVLPPPTLLLGRMLPFFYTVVRDPLLCYPLLHYRWGRCCPFLYGWLRDPSLCYPPRTLLLGRMLPVFYMVGARSSTVLPSPTLLLGQMLPVFLIWLAGRTFIVFPPTLHLG